MCIYIYISNPYIVHPQKTPHHPSHLDLHQKLPSAPQVDHSNQDDSDRFRLKASLYRISVASINGYTHFICIGNTLYIWCIYIYTYIPYYAHKYIICMYICTYIWGHCRGFLLRLSILWVENWTSIGSGLKTWGYRRELAESNLSLSPLTVLTYRPVTPNLAGFSKHPVLWIGRQDSQWKDQWSMIYPWKSYCGSEDVSQSFKINHTAPQQTYLEDINHIQKNDFNI